MSDSFEKLGIELEVKPLAASDAVFAELVKKLSDIREGFGSIVTATDKSTAGMTKLKDAVKDAGAEVKEVVKNLETTSLNKAIKLEVNKVDISQARATLDKAVAEIQKLADQKDVELAAGLKVDRSKLEKIAKELEKEFLKLSAEMKEIPIKFGYKDAEHATNALVNNEAEAKKAAAASDALQKRLESITNTYERLQVVISSTTSKTVELKKVSDIIGHLQQVLQAGGNSPTVLDQVQRGLASLAANSNFTNTYKGKFEKLAEDIELGGVEAAKRIRKSKEGIEKAISEPSRASVVAAETTAAGSLDGLKGGTMVNGFRIIDPQSLKRIDEFLTLARETLPAITRKLADLDTTFSTATQSKLVAIKGEALELSSLFDGIIRKMESVANSVKQASVRIASKEELAAAGKGFAVAYKDKYQEAKGADLALAKLEAVQGKLADLGKVDVKNVKNLVTPETLELLDAYNKKVTAVAKAMESFEKAKTPTTQNKYSMIAQREAVGTSDLSAAIARNIDEKQMELSKQSSTIRSTIKKEMQDQLAALGRQSVFGDPSQATGAGKALEQIAGQVKGVATLAGHLNEEVGKVTAVKQLHTQVQSLNTEISKVDTISLGHFLEQLRAAETSVSALVAHFKTLGAASSAVALGGAGGAGGGDGGKPRGAHTTMPSASAIELISQQLGNPTEEAGQRLEEQFKKLGVGIDAFKAIKSAKNAGFDLKDIDTASASKALDNLIDLEHKKNFVASMREEGFKVYKGKEFVPSTFVTSQASAQDQAIAEEKRRLNTKIAEEGKAYKQLELADDREALKLKQEEISLLQRKKELMAQAAKDAVTRRAMEKELEAQNRKSPGMQEELAANAIRTQALAAAEQLRNRSITLAQARELETPSPTQRITDVTTNLRARQLQGEKIAINEIKEALRQANIELTKLSDKDLGHLNQQLGKIGAEVKNGGIEAKQAGGAFSFLGEGIGRVATRLAEFYAVRTVMFAVSSQIRTAIKDVIDFNQGLADTAAISNASAQSMLKYRDTATFIAQNSKMNIQEVMKMMNLLAQSGVKETNVPAVAKATAMFATATGSSAENAVRTLTTLLNVYGLEAKDAARVTDVLTSGLNSAKIEVNDLNTVFNYLAPTAKNVGMSLQEMMATVATLSNVGLKPSTIGTNMEQLLTKLMAPTAKIKELLKAYDIDQESVNPLKHKFAEIIKVFEDSKVKVDDLMAAFGPRGGRGLQAAIVAGSEAFTLMEKNVSLSGTTFVAYSKVVEGTEARINALRQTFVASVGSLDEYNGIIKVGYDLSLGFARALGTTEGHAGVLGLALTGLGVAAVAALAGIQTALATLKVANPEIAAISIAIGLAVSGISILVGGLKSSSAEATAFAEKQTTNAKKMGDAQRVFSELMEMYSKAPEKGAKLTEEHKHKLEDLVKQYPFLREQIDKTVNTYGDLGKAIDNVNLKMEKMSKESLRMYNAQVKGVQTELREGGYYKKVAEIQESTQARKAYVDSAQFNNGPSSVYSGKTRDEAKEMIQDREDRELAALKKYFISKNPATYAGLEKLSPVVARYTPNPGLDPIDDPRILGFRTLSDAPLPALTSSEVKETGKIAGKDKEKKGQSAPDATIDLDKANLKIAQEQLRLIKEQAKEENVTLDELVTLRKAAFDKLKTVTELNDKMQIDELKNKYFKKYDEDPAKRVYRKDKDGNEVDHNKVNERFQLEKELIEAESEAQAQALQNSFDTDEKKIKHSIEAHLASIDSILLDADKKMQETILKNQEKIVADAHTGTAERAEAAAAALIAEYAKIEDEVNKQVNKLKEQLFKDQVNMSDEAYLEARHKIDRIKATIPTRKQEVKETSDRNLMSGETAHANLTIKTNEEALATQQKSITLQEKEAWGYQEKKQLQIESLELAKQTYEKNSEIAYQNYEMLYNLGASQTQLDAAYETYDKIDQKLEDINYHIGEKAKGSWELFKEGANEAYTTLTDTDRLAKNLGSSMTNTAMNGFSGAISDSIGTIFNPDTQKINDLKISIAKLKQEKATTEADIHTIEMNSAKTPQEIQSLNDKKIKLAEINSQLDKQDVALKKQTNAWAAFADGLKNTMKLILAELQKYVAQLIAVAFAKKMIGLAVNIGSSLLGGIGGGGTTTSPDTLGGSGQLAGGEMSAANGGILTVQGFKHYAGGGAVDGSGGGHVSLSMGKSGVDSVHTLLMPGEVVIKKSSVDYYGADRLLALNDQKLQKFASGGFVGGNRGSNSSPTKSGDQILQIVNVSDMSQIPAQPVDAQQVINIIQVDAGKRGPVYKTIKAVANGG